MDLVTSPLFSSLEHLSEDYPWKESLQTLAGCLAIRLVATAASDFSEQDSPLLQKGGRLVQQLHNTYWPQRHHAAECSFEVSSSHAQAGPSQDAEGKVDGACWQLPLPIGEVANPLRLLPGPAQLVLLLALAPHLYPGFLDYLLHDHQAPASGGPLFGGVPGTHYRGLLPTGETALFLLAGTDLLARQTVLAAVLGPDQPLFKSGLLSLAEVPAGEPRLSGRLVLEAHALELLTTGRTTSPQFGPDFPAQRLTTHLTWDDLILPLTTRTLVEDISHWVNHQAALHTDWGLGRHLKPGYRVLFYGPPGTGKSLTACLLGKQINREVYRVDLSLVTSKYIGETEKNLGRLFDRAHARGWILFFDEADALFGKRTDTTDAHDRFANQEVAYLLQKVEEYDGLVVLASNLKGNIDPAFARRFQAMVHFPLPNTDERLQLWQRTLPATPRWGEDLHLTQLAARHELSGASILNVAQFAILRTLGQGGSKLLSKDIMEGIRLEYLKEGKLL